MIRRIVIGLALVAIAVGIFARLDSLGTKSIWTDETFSMLRASGHHEKAIYALFDARVHRASALADLQTVGASPDLAATIASLHEEPQRGPLYYVALRFWALAFGSGIAHDRSLSALLGIFGIGLAYLLGRELTRERSDGNVGGLVLAALFAVAPMEIRYAQQIREYVLLADLALLSAYVTSRLIARPSVAWFVAFGASVLAGVYTNPTFVFLACAEVLVACVAARRTRIPRIAIGALAGALFAALLYAPWALVATRNASEGAAGVSWAGSSYSLKSSAMKWVFNTGAVFFDSEYAHLTWSVVLVPLLALVAFAAYRAIVGRGALVPRLIALALACATLVPLVVIDLLHRSHFALVARYEMTTWVGIDVLVALAIVEGLGANRAAVRAFAVCAFAFAAVAGSAAAAIDRHYSVWWDNNDRVSERAIGEAISARGPAGLVVSGSVYPTFALARYLAPQTPMLLTGDVTRAFPHADGPLYLVTPSRDEIAAVTAAAGRAPQNVSPDIGLELHDLTSAGAADPLSASNALWVLR